MDNRVDPLPVSERILTLDIVRGFALLGILIMNMPGFTNSFFIEADGSHLWTQPWDQGAELVRDMLFSGKFNSMFSLLFGIGFTIQLGRLQQREPERATAIYTRRLLALLAFGLIHAMVFWTGDVLHIYALLGFLLLLLRHVSNRTVVILIALCLLYPAVSGTLRLLLMTPEIVKERVVLMQAWEATNNAAYGHGSFLAAAGEHARELLFFYDNPWNFWGTFGFYVQMTTTMLIGFLIGRNGWVRRIPELMPVIKRLQWWALGIGIACSLFFGIVGEMNRAPGPSPIKILISITYVVSRVSLMCFYVLTVTRLAQSLPWQRIFAPMAAAGRMPLSNYLMQTLIATAIFYGWGFGMWGRMGAAAGLALAFAIFFVIQVPISLWWLRRFAMGPMEWVWRYLTYGHAPVMARAGASSGAPSPSA
ncbi:MAG: DUF418 domain-containing protein [Casimicrobiaceae bacterium]